MARLKNRAALVQQFSPNLTHHGLTILQWCGYEKPGFYEGASLNRPRALVRLGLLEEDPTAPGWFRVTDAGSQVVTLWRMAGF